MDSSSRLGRLGLALVAVLGLAPILALIVLSWAMVFGLIRT